MSYCPIKVDDNTVQIHEFAIDLTFIGCKHSADDILAFWKILEVDKHIPLLYVAERLAKLEVGDPAPLALPLPYHVIRLVDTALACNNLPGSQARIASLKKHLTSLVMKDPSNSPFEQEDLTDHILRELIQTTDEFQIAQILNDITSSVEFVNAKKGGADFRIESLGANVEAKSSLNRKKEYNFSLIRQIDSKAIEILLSNDAAKSGKLNKAFEKQNANIVIANVSHSSYGPIFSQVVYMSGSTEYDVDKIIKKAKDLVQEGKKVVILLCEGVTASEGYKLNAMVLEKERVERYAEIIGMAAKQRNLKESPENYFRILELAEELSQSKN